MAKSSNKSDERDTKSDDKSESTGEVDTKPETGGETEKESESKPEAEEEKEPEDEKETEEPVIELSKEDILQIFKNIPGVGQVMAEQIFEAGFDTKEKLETMTVDDLIKLPGIGKVLSEKIVNNLDSAFKEFEKPSKAEEKKGPGITDKTIGFFKGTISKIASFFKGKSPKPKKKSPAETDLAEGKGEDIKIEDTTGSEVIKDEGTKPEQVDNEEYYPEVGAAAVPKPEPEPESVTITTSEPEIESEPVTTVDVEASIPLEPEAETRMSASETTNETIPELPATPEINLNESSGLLKWFETSEGLRSETGKLLFKAGYNNLEELREAVVEDLILVRGINPEEAETIYEELQKLS